MRATYSDMQVVLSDLRLLSRQLADVVRHVGVFGSALQRPTSEIGDIDVLVLYEGISFQELCDRITTLPLRLPAYPAFLNVTYVKAEKRPQDPPGYHMILMPIHDPCWAFLEVHRGAIYYVTEPFVSSDRHAHDKTAR
jgi:hypothetical protein